MVAPLADIKKLFSRVKDSMLKSSTSVDPIRDCLNLINTLAEGPELSSEQSNFIYGEFFREIGSRAAGC